MALWKKVWLGLYQVRDCTGPYHHERIEALYHGAGLTRSYRLGELQQVLNRPFFEYSRNHGMGGLKLYEGDGLSPRTLEAIIELLEAYEREIPNLHKIYAILRDGQIGLGQYECVTVRTHQTQRRYLEIAEPLEKRLRHFDARMDVLMVEAYDEADRVHARNPALRRGVFVHKKAFA